MNSLSREKLLDFNRLVQKFVDHFQNQASYTPTWVDLSSLKIILDEEFVSYVDRYREAYNLLGLDVLEHHAIQMIMANTQPGISALLCLNRCIC